MFRSARGKQATASGSPDGECQFELDDSPPGSLAFNHRPGGRRRKAWFFGGPGGDTIKRNPIPTPPLLEKL